MALGCKWDFPGSSKSSVPTDSQGYTSSPKNDVWRDSSESTWKPQLAPYPSPLLPCKNQESREGDGRGYWPDTLPGIHSTVQAVSPPTQRGFHYATQAVLQPYPPDSVSLVLVWDHRHAPPHLAG